MDHSNNAKISLRELSSIQHCLLPSTLRAQRFLDDEKRFVPKKI